MCDDASIAWSFSPDKVEAVLSDGEKSLSRDSDALVYCQNTGTLSRKLRLIPASAVNSKEDF